MYGHIIAGVVILKMKPQHSINPFQKFSKAAEGQHRRAEGAKQPSHKGVLKPHFITTCLLVVSPHGYP